MAPDREFRIPNGAAASVKIIDTTSNISKQPFSHIMGPGIQGVEYAPEFPVWSFLVENSQGRKILFDLGIRKDWKSLAPVVANRLIRMNWGISVERDLKETLESNGVQVGEFEAVIWSHWHWDYVGDPSVFPENVALIVGAGFKEAFMPGYLAREDFILLESDYDGREMIEIDFDGLRTLAIGHMRAYDYFEDGSFYLLDAPGHAIGHLCGLVRTTSNPDTFMLLGADAVHDAGSLRPSQFLPFPESIDLRQLLPRTVHTTVCPGHVLEDLQRSRGRKPDEPVFVGNIAHDIGEMVRTVEKLQHADADENVFFVYAHDRSIMGVVDYFSKEANDWKSKGWAKKVKWAFLKEYWHALNLDEIA